MMYRVWTAHPFEEMDGRVQLDKTHGSAWVVPYVVNADSFKDAAQYRAGQLQPNDPTYTVGFLRIGETSSSSDYSQEVIGNCEIFAWMRIPKCGDDYHTVVTHIGQEFRDE